MSNKNTHNNRQVNTSGMTDEEIALAEDCVDKIMHSKSMNEVMAAWSRAMTSSAKVILSVHRAVGDIMVNVATGRDSRFLTEDLYKYFDHAKTVT